MPLCGNAYKVSVTGLAFWVRWHDKHYDDEPPSVAFPPLVPYGTTFPPRGIGRATKGKRLYGQARRLTSPDLHILCRMCTVDNKAPQSNPFTQRIAKNKVPPPGGRWWRQPPKGVHFLARRAVVWFSSGEARLSGFRRQRRHLYWRPQGRRTSPAQRYYITPEGESPQPACKAKPITVRTLAAQGQRPGGWLNPHARKGVSTYGNTGKHRAGPDPNRAEGACP